MDTLAKDAAPSLPPEAAFVLQLRSDTNLADGTIAGRVEHVASGQATRFATLPELLAFLERAMGAVTAGRDAPGGA